MTIKEEVLKELFDDPSKHVAKRTERTIDLTLKKVEELIDEIQDNNLDQISKYIKVLHEFECLKKKEKEQITSWLIRDDVLFKVLKQKLRGEKCR